MAREAAPSPMPYEKLVRVFDTEQESEAFVVQGLLESTGIDCQIGANENSPDVLPVGGISIEVRAEDAERARAVIEEYRRVPGQEEMEEGESE
jgi:Putative prokaryotic signal transducing protein